MRFPQLILVIVLSVLAASATTSYINRATPPDGTSVTSATKAESAFDRVKRTGILRCGYYVFPPVTLRDPNTRALSGMGVDTIEQLLHGTGIKVEWAEEVDFGNWQAGLEARRFDAVCTPMWPEASLAREALFTRPILYSGINVYARGDDHRFDNNLAAINDPSVTIVVIEGEGTAYTALNTFPKAKLLALPQNAPGGSMAESVVTKKADVMLWDENGVHDFLASNPNSIRNVAPDHPVKVMPFVLVTKLGDSTLREFLNVGLQSLEDTGIMNQLMDKWERVPGSFYRLAKPYVVPNVVNEDKP